MQRRHLALVGAVASVALLTVFLWGRVGVTADEPTPQRPAVTLKVLLPEEDAKLWIDKALQTGTGTERKVVAPPLPAGRDYYVVKALWEPNNYTKITRAKKVIVKDSTEVVVDLRQKDPKNPDDIKVRYVPTPDVVVDAMCKMAKVNKDDVVYDLGCGDGRIVITAVKKYGAKRGVGVDFDPERVKDSKENADLAKVNDKVEFRQADVLKLKDLSDATVVMLYMGDDINQRLRPILQKTLKAGSRVVSHRFLMGDWRPLQSQTVHGAGGEAYDVHLWIIGQESKKE